jgi:hypothetical protein
MFEKFFSRKKKHVPEQDSVEDLFVASAPIDS